MSTTGIVLTALVFAGVVAGQESSGEDASAYLAEKDGRKELKAPLTLREEQSGFAGTTGTVFTIEPSGRWRVERFRRVGGDKEELTPVRSGTLSQSDLEALAKALASQDLAGLAEKAGREPKVNAHRITIRFGTKASTLEGLPPRRGRTSLADHIREAAPRDEQASRVWDRFAGLVQAVERHCPEPKAP
jgi:hypothetical protein